jgi:hypothetical protein
MKYYYQIEGYVRNNIGDTLQGLAAKAFLPINAEAADREALADLGDKTPSVLVANGWYMHRWDKFPPPEIVKPIYISVHIARTQMLAEKRILDHFKKNAPIGCRDQKSLLYFLGWGIPAYYSSCLTITTQPRAEINNSGKGEYILVDNMDHVVPDHVLAKLEELYGQKFIRISHDPIESDMSFEEYAKDTSERMNLLLKRYCEAALVVTTKIHCALPCLGMGANVMLIHPDPKDFRLDTVKKYMRIYSYEDVLAMQTIPTVKIDKKRLKKYQAFLSGIVSKSVDKGYNIMSKPDTLKLKYIRIKSIIMAKSFRLAVTILYKLGVSKKEIGRVFFGIWE